MGAEASRPAKRAAAWSASSIRIAGEPMNTLNYPVAHEKVMPPPARTPQRMVVCRCWKSLKFPACDNSHFQLQKEGVTVGPAMLEIRPGPTPVAAEQIAPHPRLMNLSGGHATSLGVACAIVLATAGQAFGGQFFV
mmetsp:Transcript_106860/g.212192  ORF Transcript_106860/g.212192 Transcript_106860/m.212192 type:complete len:136 (-) Transcript_106860:120-527(-)|eukprot:CAMPEP_0172863668 /NCGR_PEP_ID=MMETSP1075-20121228/78011_1 /TAXON_ID=2916 /ORGANISM="Ceratium fusus, Strain PA161109" /LENGTH=135 /DNA_ID=CAMNT_0013712345 /DNA_START=42 /DNA_END=449 /DNA_ORIENTATION=+